MSTDDISGEERVLYALAVQRIRAGTLPDREPSQAWSSKGGGDACALCDKRIGRSDSEYQALDGADRVFLFHFRCYAIWRHVISGFSSQHAR